MRCISQSREKKAAPELSWRLSPPLTEWPYLTVPYIFEQLDQKITNIFRKEGLPVRVAHKSYTLRRALSSKTTERTCTRETAPSPTPSCAH